MTIVEERKAKWAGLIAAQHASGMSIVAWCYQHGVNEGTFYYWRKRLAEMSAGAPQWVAVSAIESADSLTLRVGRVAIEVNSGFDPRLLAAVLAVVAA